MTPEKKLEKGEGGSISECKQILNAVRDYLRKSSLVEATAVIDLATPTCSLLFDLIEQDLHSFEIIRQEMERSGEVIRDKEAHQQMGRVLLLAHYLEALDYVEMSGELTASESGQHEELAVRNKNVQAKIMSAEQVLREKAGDILDRYGLDKLRELLDQRVSLADFIEKTDREKQALNHEQRCNSFALGGSSDGSRLEEPEIAESRNSCFHCERFGETLCDELRLGTVCLKLFFLLSNDDSRSLDMSKDQVENLCAWEAYARCLSRDCEEFLNTFSSSLRSTLEPDEDNW